MSAIVNVTNGVTAIDQVHVNQYSNALNNVLGITDDAQDALGRLVLPRASSVPGSPSQAMLFYHTTSGQVFGYDGANWIGLFPMLKAASHISPTQITSNQNDYNPAGLADAEALLLTSDAARSITGIVAPVASKYRRLLVVENGSAFAITLVANSGLSAAVNRFTMPADIVLSANGGTVLLYYNASTSPAWYCVGKGF